MTGYKPRTSSIGSDPLYQLSHDHCHSSSFFVRPDETTTTVAATAAVVIVVVDVDVADAVVASYELFQLRP